MLLVVVTLLAYFNAWPNTLVFDDREFLAGGRFDSLGFSDFIRLFSQSLWEAGANTSSLYRPLLLVSFGLENKLFGDWFAGYHLANILRHVLAVLLVFGFISHIFQVIGYNRQVSRRVSLMATSVFAVHPVLTDAVDSVFNGSEIYVTIAVVGGLWYLLSNYRDKPVRAWTIAGLLYFLALLYKESAVSMPALAVALIWLTSDKPRMIRLARCLPVLALALPLAVYMGIRAEALETRDSLASQLSPDSTTYTAEAAPIEQVPNNTPQPQFLEKYGLSFDSTRTVIAVTMWFDALKLMVWPHPLVTMRGLSDTPIWLAAPVQLALLVCGLFAMIRKRPALIIGLVFFYIAILPASRIVGEGILNPILLDRMLYLPSVGLAICLAAGFAWLAGRFRGHATVVVATMIVLAFVPVTWARNADWSDEIRLLENDFSVMGGHGQLLSALVRAQAAADNLGRSMELCVENSELVREYQTVTNECGKAFTGAGRYAKAEAYFLQSLERNPIAARTHFHLARLYVRMDRRQDAREHFNQAIEREKLPFLNEFMHAIMLMDMYPHDRKRLMQARQHLENVLLLQPRDHQARNALQYLDEKL